VDPDLAALAGGLGARLVGIDGIVGVTIGGSVAAGTASEGSDLDLGLYYRGRPDVAALRALAADVADAPVEVTEPGAWGPWVDGGAWLLVGGRAVDWIYRDVDRVEQAWADCQRGETTCAHQVGHPLGFWSHAYAGEVALATIVEDPTGQLAAIQAAARVYPPELRRRLVAGLWEARFSLDIAAKAAPRGDISYVAGCLFRTFGLAAQALCAHGGRWLTNEKGALAIAAALDTSPPDFEGRTGALFAALSPSAAVLAVTIEQARAMLDEVDAAVSR
jgi:hypothetical protein